MTPVSSRVISWIMPDVVSFVTPVVVFVSSGVTVVSSGVTVVPVAVENSS